MFSPLLTSSQEKMFQENYLSLARQLAPYQGGDGCVQRSRDTSISADSGFDQQRESPLVPHLEEEEDVEQAVLQQLQVCRQIPYRDYTCHRCYQRGHMIQHCPTKNGVTEKSPYQGDRKSKGIFECQKCHRQWKSSNTYANKAYPCKNCGQKTFPTKMYPIQT